jgi:hypothetical protein
MSEIEIDGEVFSSEELLTPEWLQKTSNDHLIDAYENLHAQENKLRGMRIEIARTLASRAPSETGAKTTRIRGERRRAKIEWPDDSWDQGLLKQAWHGFPDLRNQYLAIDKIRPQLIEVRKMQNESGPETFEAFKATVLSANRGPQGVPRIVIET